MSTRDYRRLPRVLLAGLTLAALALSLLQPAGAGAQSDERCFPETGYCISGPIRAYWERNGGLAVFGYPITGLRTETVEATWTGPTQWFERDRLEDHSADGQGVLAGRLGVSALELQGLNWRTLPLDGTAAPGCRYFPNTELNLCGTFLRYWEQNGGLERFGYPITRQREETIEGRTYTVQYFERRRMELHPENAGTPFEVQLGLLGRSVYSFVGDVNVIEVAPGDVAADIQQAILDAAYRSVRDQGERGKLAVGIMEVAGDQATVLAQPYGKPAFTVALTRASGTWAVIPATETPGGNGYAIIELALQQLQDVRGGGLNAYVTIPRVAGDYARLSAAPGASENLDGVSMFFKREQGTWRFLSAGTAFREEDLRALGVPEELWSYGASVRGPA